ncbi:unnamed protein product [Prorocentrum cordatum]|uniref:Uncharacterized protein n=1 Tax=Prorocentrum cordatum TaxID=2364126 RepID=A0ABN9RBH2_9DINO|nr:unnamed protein product [Polarella glacialis]
MPPRRERERRERSPPLSRRKRPKPLQQAAPPSRRPEKHADLYAFLYVCCVWLAPHARGAPGPVTIGQSRDPPRRPCQRRSAQRAAKLRRRERRTAEAGARRRKNFEQASRDPCLSTTAPTMPQHRDLHTSVYSCHGVSATCISLLSSELNIGRLAVSEGVSTSPV